MTAGQIPPPEAAIALSRQGLDEALLQVSARLAALADGKPPPPFRRPEHSALPRLGTIFALEAEALEVLALAAGHALDPTIAGQLAALTGGGLTPHLVEKLLGPSAWDHLAPHAPLRHWRLIEVIGNGPLHRRDLVLDERVLQALLGGGQTDIRLAGLVRMMPPSRNIDPQIADQAAQIVSVWRGASALPLILLGGPADSAKRQLAQVVAADLRLGLLHLRAEDIPADAASRAGFATLIDRELALSDAILLIETTPDTAPRAALLAEALTGPTLLAADDPPLTERVPRLRVDCHKPTEATRRAAWAEALGQRAEALGEGLDRLAGQFTLDWAGVDAALAGLAPDTRPEALEDALWDRARVEGRRGMAALAEQIPTNASWDDLVLPVDALDQLKQIEAHVRHGWRLRGDWGWGAKTLRGLGCSALFSGPSGTGKTLAAEVLAGALRLDLFRIDLSQVVNKYIGETEKNLGRIFDAAEAGGAILLFDEADALFGKRTEVRDSHDRYANQEVSYLLQRMESYQGLAILTTNFREALDKAFLRRLRFIVNFPFPDQALRSRIWAQAFPKLTPTSGLEPQKLARLSLAGGSIRSVALNAAAMAAAGPEPVTMVHIRRAVRREYAKMDKPFTAAEQGALA